MNTQTHQTTRNDRQSGSTHGPLRRQMVHLRRDMDRFERMFSTWMQTRRERESQADVRMHVIEAQLARLNGSGTMGAVRPSSLVPPVSERPVVHPIAAYRAL